MRWWQGSEVTGWRGGEAVWWQDNGVVRWCGDKTAGWWGDDKITWSWVAKGKVNCNTLTPFILRLYYIHSSGHIATYCRWHKMSIPLPIYIYMFVFPQTPQSFPPSWAATEVSLFTLSTLLITWQKLRRGRNCPILSHFHHLGQQLSTGQFLPLLSFCHIGCCDRESLWIVESSMYYDI